MKLIDRTPFFQDGQISATDRLKAMWKYGASWLKEVEAQAVAIEALEKGLARGYTLLRNITLAGLDIEIPLILVGPTGIYVLYVTPLRGTYRARGEEWGPIEGESFRPARVNLLRRTARLGRAVQVYLQKQGFSDLPPVEAVLLCADPGLIVESARPIVRVVQRDALERFAVSISQGRVVLGAERVQQIVNRLLNPLPPPTPQSKAPAAPVTSATPPAPAASAEPYVPPFALPPDLQPDAAPETPAVLPEAPAASPFDRYPEMPPNESPSAPAPEAERLDLGFQFMEEASTGEAISAPARPQPVAVAVRPAARAASVRPAPAVRRRSMTTGQVIVILLLVVIQCAIFAVAAYLLWPYFAP